MSKEYDEIYNAIHPVQFTEGCVTVQHDNCHTCIRRRKRLLIGMIIGGSLFGLAAIGYYRGWFTRK